MRRFAIVLLVLLSGVATAGAQAESAATPRSPGKLYVDVSSEDYVEVIDLATRRAVKKIVVGPRPHGLAFSRRVIAGRPHALLYVTIEDTGELVIVDAERDVILGRILVGNDPNQLTLTRDGRFAYVPLRGEAKVAVVELDFATKPDPAGKGIRIEPRPRVIKKIAIGEWPHNSYTGQTTGRVYVTSFRGRKIHVFDPQLHKLLFEIEFPGEVRPVALTRDESRAYVALSDFHGFVVVDVASRRIIQRVALPPLPPGTPEPFLKTYVHGLTLSPEEDKLWVTSCAGAAVYEYSLVDLKLEAKVSTGKFPHWFAWQPPAPTAKGKAASAGLLWVSLMESDQVSAIDPAKREIVATVPTGPAPRRIVVAQ